MKCLFLGGPWHGRFADVAADSSTVCVPILAVSSTPLRSPGSAVTDYKRFDEVVYERGALTDPAGRYTIYTTGEASKAPIAHMLALLEKKS